MQCQGSGDLYVPQLGRNQRLWPPKRTSLKLLPSDWCSLLTCDTKSACFNRRRHPKMSEFESGQLYALYNLCAIEAQMCHTQRCCEIDQIRASHIAAFGSIACLIRKSSAGGCLILWRPQALQHILRFQLHRLRWPLCMDCDCKPYTGLQEIFSYIQAGYDSRRCVTAWHILFTSRRIEQITCCRDAPPMLKPISSSSSTSSAHRTRFL